MWVSSLRFSLLAKLNCEGDSEFGEFQHMTKTEFVGNVNATKRVSWTSLMKLIRLTRQRNGCDG